MYVSPVVYSLGLGSTECMKQVTSFEPNSSMVKTLSIFYTPPVCAELLAQLAVRDARATTLDLACGDGKLLTAAYRTKLALLRTASRERSPRLQTCLLRELFGVDIVPDSAKLAAARLMLAAGHPGNHFVNITVSNSANILPGKELPALNLLTEPVREAVKGREQEGLFRIEPVDVVLMNPPFTRQERLGTRFKHELRENLARYGTYTTARLGLYGYFVFLADMFVRKGGRIGLVLPASFLRLKSTVGLRRLLCENYDIECLVIPYERSALSESSAFAEIMLVARKRKSMEETEYLDTADRPGCLIVHLTRVPKERRDAQHVSDTITALELSAEKVYRDSTLSARKIPQDMLNLHDMASMVLPVNQRAALLWSTIQSEKDNLIPLGDYLRQESGEILRGLETRSDLRVQIQKTFILKNESRARGLRDQWILDSRTSDLLVCRNRRTEERVRTPTRSLRNGLRRLSGLNRIDISNETDYIFYSAFPAFLRTMHGNTMRKRWMCHVKDRGGNLVLARRFGICRSGTKLLAFYCRDPVAPSGAMWTLKNIEPGDAKILALWFNSSPSILQLMLKCVETSGPWMELPQYLANDLLVLDPRRLSSAQTKMLLKTFGRFRSVVFPSLREQFSSGFKPRLALDNVVLRSLGHHRKKAASMTEQTRLLLAHELESLQRIDKANKRHVKLHGSES